MYARLAGEARRRGVWSVSQTCPINRLPRDMHRADMQSFFGAAGILFFFFSGEEGGIFFFSPIPLVFHTHSFQRKERKKKKNKKMKCGRRDGEKKKNKCRLARPVGEKRRHEKKKTKREKKYKTQRLRIIIILLRRKESGPWSGADFSLSRWKQNLDINNGKGLPSSIENTHKDRNQFLKN